MLMFKLPSNDLDFYLSTCHVCHKLTVTYVSTVDAVTFFILCYY